MFLNPADLGLLDRAVEAARTENEIIARKSAQAVQKSWGEAQAAALEALNNDDLQNIKRAASVPWQEHIIGLDHAARKTAVCALVEFYSEAVRLPSYQQQMELAVRHGFNLHHRKTRSDPGRVSTPKI
ncbi:hypothetical protein ACJZ2D_011550 [Fusarium nematophilum]